MRNIKTKQSVNTRDFLGNMYDEVEGFFRCFYGESIKGIKTVIFDDGSDGKGPVKMGFITSEEINTVFINSFCDEFQKVLVFVHEMTHIMQNERNKTIVTNHSPFKFSAILSLDFFNTINAEEGEDEYINSALEIEARMSSCQFLYEEIKAGKCAFFAEGDTAINHDQILHDYLFLSLTRGKGSTEKTKKILGLCKDRQFVEFILG